MAIKNRSQLKAYADTYRNTNGSQSMTGATENVMWNDVIDSFVSISDPESYQWFQNTDPATIGNPPVDNYYQGIYNGKRWSKEPDGTIVYSASGLWTIYDVPDTVIIPDEEWLGNLVRWNGTEDGTITMDSSTFTVPEGFHFSIYNNTPNYHINIEAGGTDVIRSHNNILQIPAYSYATIGLIYTNGIAEWYASIEQNAKKGLGQIANGAAGIAITAGAGTWHEVVFPLPLYGSLTNVSAGPTDGSLMVDYPNNETNGTYATLSAGASIELQEANQTVDFSFGINGVISASAEFVKASATSAGTSTTDQYWTYAQTYSGIVNNGDYLSLFVRSNVAATVSINSVNMNLNTDAFIGVDIQT